MTGRCHPTGRLSCYGLSCLLPPGLHAFFAILFCVAGTLGAPASTLRASVHVVRIDGTTVSGEWIGTPDGKTVDIKTADGLQRIPLDGLSSVTFRAQEKRRNKATSTSVLFHLADGGRLYGELVAKSPADSAAAQDDAPTSGGTPAEGNRLIGRTALGDSVALAFDRLAGLQLTRGADFPRAGELFRAALADRLPGHDVLITRTPDGPRALRGRLEHFDASGGAFVFGDRARRFQAEKVFGVVFAAGVAGDRLQPYPVTLTLVDGSVLSGRMERADTDSLRLATSLGIGADLPINMVATIKVRSERVVYVSSLSPSAERREGLLHRPWPVGLDRSVTGGPLSIGGHGFDRGIGVHSLTALDFPIDGVFEAFAATIGIDDAVRPRGSVVFRVLGDGKVLFDSGLVTGADPPRDILVDVVGVNSLTLLVDYGEELDLADAAVWGDARLLKPPAVAEPDTL